jgi:hypothetical protein
VVLIIVEVTKFAVGGLGCRSS